MNEAHTAKVAIFGSYRFDLSTFELRKSGIPLRFEDKPALVLTHLIEHAGEIVSREDLQALLWPEGVHVNYDHGLNKAINRLRAVLADNREQPRFIETLSRKGYRFVAPVQFCSTKGNKDQVESVPPVEVPASPSPPLAPVSLHLAVPQSPFRRHRTAAAVAMLSILILASAIYLARRESRTQPNLEPQVHRIVVLPFENLTGDSAQDYFCDGLSDELIAQIGTLNPQKLQVIARASAWHYRGSRLTAAQIGEELKSNYILDGSVRRLGAMYHIAVQLTDVRTQSNVWNRTFDREFKDMFDVQRDVVLAVSRQIGDRISPKFQHPAFGAQPINPLAHEAYLRGRFHWNKRTVTDLRDSVDEFERAIAIDADYPEAHAGLADAYSLLASYGAIPFRKGYPQAREEAKKALRLNPKSAEARTSLAFVEAYYDWKFAEAEQDFLSAISENPNYATAHHWYGLFLSQRGRHLEGVAELTSATQLDPYSLTIGIDLANAYAYAGRYRDAEHQLLKVRSLDPDYYGTYGTMCWVYSLQNRLREAEQENEVLKRLSGNYIGNDHILAYAYAKAGESGRARELLSQISNLAHEHGDRPPCPIDVYLALHDQTTALHCLDEGIRERADWLVPLGQNPEIARVASDPRFEERLRQVGLFPTGGAGGGTR